MIIRQVEKSIVEKEPFQVWNAFINILAKEEYENLNEIQRMAHLAFWYDTEVNNGGHLQYFENFGIKHLRETIKALKSLGALAQAEILQEAGNQFLSKVRKPIKSMFSFVRQAKEAEYESYDNQFYECSPTIIELLEKYLENNQGQFVEIV